MHTETVCISLPDYCAVGLVKFEVDIGCGSQVRVHSFPFFVFFFIEPEYE